MLHTILRRKSGSAADAQMDARTTGPRSYRDPGSRPSRRP